MYLVFVAPALSASHAVENLRSHMTSRSGSLGRLEEGHLPPQLGQLTSLKVLALSCDTSEAGRLGAHSAGEDASRRGHGPVRYKDGPIELAARFRATQI